MAGHKIIIPKKTKPGPKLVQATPPAVVQKLAQEHGVIGLFGTGKPMVDISAIDKNTGKPVTLHLPEEKFKALFEKAAQAQHDAFVENVKAMPPDLEQTLLKTLGVSKDSLLKEAEKHNPAVVYGKLPKGELK